MHESQRRKNLKEPTHPAQWIRKPFPLKQLPGCTGCTALRANADIIFKII